MIDLAFKQPRADVGRSLLTCLGIPSVFAVMLLLQEAVDGVRVAHPMTALPAIYE